MDGRGPHPAHPGPGSAAPAPSQPHSTPTPRSHRRQSPNSPLARLRAAPRGPQRAAAAQVPSDFLTRPPVATLLSRLELPSCPTERQRQKSGRPAPLDAGGCSVSTDAGRTRLVSRCVPPAPRMQGGPAPAAESLVSRCLRHASTALHTHRGCLSVVPAMTFPQKRCRLSLASPQLPTPLSCRERPGALCEGGVLTRPCILAGRRTQRPHGICTATLPGPSPEPLEPHSCASCDTLVTSAHSGWTQLSPAVNSDRTQAVSTTFMLQAHG